MKRFDFTGVDNARANFSVKRLFDRLKVDFSDKKSAAQ